MIKSQRVRIEQLSSEISALRKEDDCDAEAKTADRLQQEEPAEEDEDDAKLKNLVELRTSASASLEDALRHAQELLLQIQSSCVTFEKTRAFFLEVIAAELGR